MRRYSLMLFVLGAVLVAEAQNTFPALLAKAPDVKHVDKLRLFGQFVGDWTFVGTEFHDDGSHPTDKGEIHCQWVLKGQALQDVFLETGRSDNQPLLYGTTIRFYDPRIDAWKVTWVNPGAGVVRTFVGRRAKEDIVMEGSSGDGSPIRWVFSRIKSDSFHWRGEKLAGSNWRVYEELDADRK